MAKTLKLTWWNECDLGNIYYAGGFKPSFYYETEIGKPSYVVDQETQQNGNAVDVILSQQRIKEYQFEVYVPEYVADALVDMALHDNIQLQTTDGLFNSLIRNVSAIPSWEDISNDCMATVTIKFQIDDQLVKNRCCTPLSVQSCLSVCANVKGFADNHSLDLEEGAYYIEAVDSNIILIWLGVDGFQVFPCANTYVYSIDAGIELYWDGSAWREAPEISSSGQTTFGGNTLVHLVGFAIPDSFVQGYYSLDGGSSWIAIGSPVTADDYATVGLFFTVSGIPDSLMVKVYMYNHNCQYQFSDPVTII